MAIDVVINVRTIETNQQGGSIVLGPLLNARISYGNKLSVEYDHIFDMLDNRFDVEDGVIYG